MAISVRWGLELDRLVGIARPHKHDCAADLPLFAGIFPDQNALIVRRADGERGLAPRSGKDYHAL